MFRFTIRDVLWLMVVVGLAIGWFAENRHLRYRVQTQTMQLDLLKTTLEQVGFHVELHKDGAAISGS